MSDDTQTPEAPAEDQSVEQSEAAPTTEESTTPDYQSVISKLEESNKALESKMKELLGEKKKEQQQRRQAEEQALKEQGEYKALAERFEAERAETLKELDELKSSLAERDQLSQELERRDQWAQDQLDTALKSLGNHAKTLEALYPEWENLSSFERMQRVERFRANIANGNGSPGAIPGANAADAKAQAYSEAVKNRDLRGMIRARLSR